MFVVGLCSPLEYRERGRFGRCSGGQSLHRVALVRISFLRSLHAGAMGVCRIGCATGDSGEVLERRDPCHRNSGQKARAGLFLIQFGENYSLGNPPAIVNFELNYLILRDYCLFSALSCFTAASTCSKSAVFVYAK